MVWFIVKWAKYLRLGDDLTLGGGHTVQYTDCVAQKYTFETCMTPLTNVTPINFMKLKK